MTRTYAKVGDRLIYTGGLPTAETFALPLLQLGVNTYSSAIYNFVPHFALRFFEAVRAQDKDFVYGMINDFIIHYIDIRNRARGYAVSIIKAGLTAAAPAAAAAAAINADLVNAHADEAVARRRSAQGFRAADEALVCERVLGDRRHGLDSMLPPPNPAGNGKAAARPPNATSRNRKTTGRRRPRWARRCTASRWRRRPRRRRSRHGEGRPHIPQDGTITRSGPGVCRRAGDDGRTPSGLGDGLSPGCRRAFARTPLWKPIGFHSVGIELTSQHDHQCETKPQGAAAGGGGHTHLPRRRRHRRRSAV
ncbi:hypothetical protein [Streptomyces sp. V4I2]|uniref:hypothetical protein n=1 Tax=Streptomyces sp. V4I2 TaxID=3042280 RepID=UPI0027D7D541|nr:hypothetical protein [Streptomyces sp. V4I2]